MTCETFEAQCALIETRALSDVHDARLLVFGKLHDAELRAGNFAGAGATGVHSAAPYGLCMVESACALSRALDAGLEPFALLVDAHVLECEKTQAACMLQQQAVVQAVARTLQAWPQTPLFLQDSSTFRHITGYPKSRGMLAAFVRPKPQSVAGLLGQLQALGREDVRICVVEDVTNYANMAAIFTSATAFGIDAIFTTPRCCDPWYRRAIRASHGLTFQVPWTCLDAETGGVCWPDEGVRMLRNQGFYVAALALREDALPIYAPELKTCKKLAFVLGTEGEGLDMHTIEACDAAVIIPMAHAVDSLNVAAASAVAFWEFAPQRLR